MLDRVPTSDEFRPAVLRVLSDGMTRTFGQLCQDAVQHLQMGQAALAENLPSGQPRYRNRLHWACSALVKAGLVNRPERGTYQITELGLQVDSRNLTSYSERDLLEWPLWQAYQQEIAERKTDRRPPQTINGSTPASETSPIEQVIELVQVHNASVETELRRRLQAGTPEFFEKAVLDLLWAMGYGGSHGEREQLGGSGDGGIDGVIRQDALGLNKVYIQAKRYADENTVGRPAIQQFFGSLSSRGADRGVFITTSRFSQGAQDEAQNYKTIVLIDGLRLTRLMLEYRVGVQPEKELTLYRADEDYFDEGLR